MESTINYPFEGKIKETIPHVSDGQNVKILFDASMHNQEDIEELNMLKGA